YLGVRYLTPRNEVWGEALNLGGQVTLTTQYRQRTEAEADATFQELSAQPRPGVRVGPSVSETGSVLLYSPISAGGGGILQIEVNLAALNSVLSQVADPQNSFYAPERASILVDADNELLSV